jgi:hypothetical protein
MSRGTCPICKRRRLVGRCDFGKGVDVTPHCRGCCSDPVRDHWRAAKDGAVKR